MSKPCTPGEHQNSWDLWMFIPLKMVLIGIDPYPYNQVLLMGWGSTVLVQLVHRDTPTLHNSAGDVEAIHRALPPYLGHNSQRSSIGFVCHTVHRVTPPLNMLLHMLLHIFGLVSSFRYHHLQGMQVKLDRHAS